ncbi:MAG: hypothetical protein IKP22_09930 [Clostridia bacterium]|nr:hypothetical protein [Clostridia bacterium]
MMTRRKSHGPSRRFVRRARRAARPSRRSPRRSGIARASVAEDRLRMIAALMDMEKYPGEYREAVRLLSGMRKGTGLPRSAER